MLHPSRLAPAAALALLACSPEAPAPQAEPNAAAPANATAPAAPPAAATNATEASDANSRYTRLNLDACTVLSRVEEGEGVEWRCPGLDSTPLYVLSGDGRYDIDAGRKGKVFASVAPFNNPGETVEWRLKNGAPVAIIFRLKSATQEAPNISWLMVETIGSTDRPSCRIATIDGRTPDANVRARAIADAQGASFRCGVDAPEDPGDLT